MVSISSEMPAPWRPLRQLRYHRLRVCFNLKRDASPVATWTQLGSSFALALFQSQARCQPRGDDEHLGRCQRGAQRFNLKRDASPVATAISESGLAINSAVSISSEVPAPWRHYNVPHILSISRVSI